MARIGVGIEEPVQNPPTEVKHILKKMRLAANATVEHVRVAIQTPETFAVLGTTDLAILAGHFNEPIEVSDDAVTGSKLDGVSNSVSDQVLAIQRRAFQKSRENRRTQLPDGGAKSDLLAKKLRAMNIAADLENEKRKALIARLAGKLGGPNIPRKGLLTPEEIRQRLLDSLNQ